MYINSQIETVVEVEQNVSMDYRGEIQGKKNYTIYAPIFWLSKVTLAVLGYQT